MDGEVYNTITEYRKRLEARGIRIKKIILYGSHITGKASKDSDLDLIVVSNDFGSMDLWERLYILGDSRADIKRPMEILGMTEEEFESEGKGTFIGDEVKKKGVEVE